MSHESREILWKIVFPMVLGVFLLVLMASLPFAVGWLFSEGPQPCRDEVAVPHWPCDPRAHIESVDGTLVCRCPAMSHEP